MNYISQIINYVRMAQEIAADYPEFARRNLNEGFSGGEKKRHEILQLELLAPKIAVLDETDSGLDIDVTPDFVHVFIGGRIVDEGGPELAETLETEGYERWVKAGAAS